MAQKVSVELVDDLDGSPADQTISYAFDGKEYEIDLSDSNVERFRKALEPFVSASRSGRRARRGGRRSSAGYDASEVREWAKKNGLEISDRGRIPSNILEKWRAATGG